MPAEFDFIDWLRDRQKRSAAVAVPAGDDLAVLNWPKGDLLLVGVDQVLDGVHFDSVVHSPADIGKKAMNRNLSDCAAMGCLSAAAVVTLTLPSGVGIDYAKALYLGIEAAGDVFNCPIVGGDTGSWPGKLGVSVTILGRTGGVAPITRSGARPGDLLYVTGPLGGSILGRHMTFTPRVEIGRQLAESGLATAMIDLSDGLSRDLKHLCHESGVGAVIHREQVPIHSDAATLSAHDHISPLEHALHDGEDYELLVALKPRPEARHLADRLQLVPIGDLLAEQEIWLNANGARTPMLPKAWEHRL